MIITKTPFRMSFFGGGTDIEDFFNENGGAVISTTFDKYCYVTVRHLPRFFDYKTHLTYSKNEYINNISDIEHPLIKNCMKFVDVHELRLIYDADLPARSGLGTSSSFAVGMLNAFYALKGQYVDKERLAKEAIYVERSLCCESGGWQDQIAASFGGLNRIDFHNSKFEVHPIVMAQERKKQLNKNLMLFFTGFTRFSSEVQKKNDVTSANKKEILINMLELVNEAERILVDDERNLDDFGRLLDYTWKLKKTTGNHISNNTIDYYYNAAIDAGALGGKLLGAGGGGFLLFYVDQPYQQNVLNALKDLLYIPFEFENEGTRIIYYAPDKAGEKD